MNNNFTQGTVIPNLNLIVTADDYAVFAGKDWPSYEDYIVGIESTLPAIREEMSDFTNKFIKQGIKFPIKTDTACQSKWTWSTIYLTEKHTSSCHRVESEFLPLEDFDNFHNLPKKIAARNAMLKGQWPGHGCEYCRDIERAGGFSDRMHNLDIRGLTPPELLNDVESVVVTPRIVEIFAQNTCNLACTYCNGRLSSQIEEEGRKFGEFHHGNVVIPVLSTKDSEINEYFNRFLQWLEKNSHTLRRLHLLGGETFIQHELMQSVINILQRNPNPNLRLCTFSNLNVPDKTWNKYIVQIKDLYQAGHIAGFDLTASIDCWGDQAEYVRHGLNLERFEQRLAWAAQESDWLKLNVNQTVTVLTIKTMPDLIKKIVEYSKYKHIGHYFQFYTGPQMFQHPRIFGYKQWANDFDQILKLMPTNTVEQQEAIPRMIGLKKLLEQFTNDDTTGIQDMQIYLDEIDRRRGTNWRPLFPFLDINV